MDSRSTPPGLLAIDESLTFEETSPIRHECVGGTLYALAGGSVPRPCPEIRLTPDDIYRGR